MTLGLIALVYAFSRAPAEGWTSITTLGTTALALALLGGFVWNEARSSHPLMPLSIFRIRNVTAANLIMAPVVAGMFGMFFLSSLFIQGVLHYSPLMTGLSFLPFPLILGIVSSTVPRFVSRYGYKPFIVTGLIFAAAGLGWMARVPLEASYFFDLLPTFVLMPIGLGMLFMPAIAAATAGVPPQEAGLASGLINTSLQMGGALGLSIFTSVATSVTAAATSPASTEALVQGYRYAFLTGLAFMLLALVLAVTLIRPRAVSALPVHAST